MKKQHILDEIKRTAEANGGVALGSARFFQETGIKKYDWFGIYWSRWSDALAEAGFAPNKFGGAFPEQVLIDKYVGLVRELGHIPIEAELRLKHRGDLSFPSSKVFERFGSKHRLLSKVHEYCRNHTGFDDVERLCQDAPSNEARESVDNERPTVADGFV